MSEWDDDRALRDDVARLLEALQAENAALRRIVRLELDALEQVQPQLHGALVITEISRIIAAARAALRGQQPEGGVRR